MDAISLFPEGGQKSIRSAIPAAVVFVLVFVCAGVWVLVFAHTPRRVLTVAMLDVGQGDSIYIESPTGQQVVVDAGPDDSLLRALPAVMPPFDRSLDAIVETHPDSDHMAGFVPLVARYEVGMLLEPGIKKDTVVVRAFEQGIDDKKIARYVARRGMWLDLGGGARLHVLFPDHDVSHINPNKDNDGGIVARVVYGETSVLLTADTSKKTEAHLLALDANGLQSTILKVGHHGSRTATSNAFVVAVQPAVAVFSLGKNNKYHFPNPEPLAILAKYGAQIVRTDQEGTIIFQSDGRHFVRVQ